MNRSNRDSGSQNKRTQRVLLQKASAALVLAVLVLLTPAISAAQHRVHPVLEERFSGSEEEKHILAAAEALRQSGQLRSWQEVVGKGIPKKCQLSGLKSAARPSLRFTGDERYRRREIARLARSEFRRIGSYYKCADCEEWHLDLVAGYPIAGGGVVATVHHGFIPEVKEMKERYLICVDSSRRVSPVYEILAADEESDAAIVWTGSDTQWFWKLDPAADVADEVFVYSDPMDVRGYFSAGIINRFFQRESATGGPPVIGMNVSCAWAPGSSGAAILNGEGQVVGHVQAIETLHDEAQTLDPTEPGLGTLMVIHHATRAEDVLALVEEIPEEQAKILSRETHALYPAVNRGDRSLHTWGYVVIPHWKLVLDGPWRSPTEIPLQVLEADPATSAPTLWVDLNGDGVRDDQELLKATTAEREGTRVAEYRLQSESRGPFQEAIDLTLCLGSHQDGRPRLAYERNGVEAIALNASGKMLWVWLEHAPQKEGPIIMDNPFEHQWRRWYFAVSESARPPKIFYRADHDLEMNGAIWWKGRRFIVELPAVKTKD